MRYFEHLHPVCIFTYFVLVIGMTLACMHPVMVLISSLGAALFLWRIQGGRAVLQRLKFIFPMFFIIAAANPLVTHRGVTLLGMLFNQWITLEAVCYGITAGLSLTALILWFSCYSAVMTSDKFLYLFGKPAPATSLLITMALRMIPGLKLKLAQIQESQEMLHKTPEGIGGKLHTALRHTSTLIGWSVENAVEQADSMKARGYGIRRRTTFHLFHFDSRDARFLCALLGLGGICIIARIFGHGTMEFYPRMDAVITGESGLILYGLFAVLACFPAILEIKEAVRWRSYGLIR